MIGASPRAPRASVRPLDGREHGAQWRKRSTGLNSAGETSGSFLKNTCYPKEQLKPPLETSLYGQPRKYVQNCGKGTLALQFKDHVSFTALTCGSWTCKTCRKVRGAQLLDRLHRGMKSRQSLNRIFVTLTLDPSLFNAVPIGKAHWDAEGNRTEDSEKAVRSTTLWSEPDEFHFKWAIESMSKQWNNLNTRLKSKARRAGVAAHGYFRVVELHRNGWPHYHVVIEHPTWKAADIQKQVSGWNLGTVVQAADISIDDAIGEVAPYLVSHESKGSGHKAYQFAGYALPEGFRLYTSSHDFLAEPEQPKGEEVFLHAYVLKGHFFSHNQAVKEFGGDSKIVLHPIQDGDLPHKPPSEAVATGDGAILYLLAQVDAQPLIELGDDFELPY